jgi:hypothetical protein
MQPRNRLRLSTLGLQIGLATLSVALVATHAVGQQPAASQAGGQPNTLPYVPNDTAGFVRIFRPGSLAGWDGDPKFWRVSGDTIIAESTPTNRVTQNTFLIYRGDPNLRDFEMKLDFRMPSGTGNSGLQLRSSVRPGAPHQWRLTGYQVDADYENLYTGMIYGELAGAFLAKRGEITHVTTERPRPQVVGSLGSDTELHGLMNTNGWNSLHVIVRGNTITSILNGRVAAILVDDALTTGVTADQARLASGLVGLQMHVGQPFKLEFRNIFLKKY